MQSSLGKQALRASRSVQRRSGDAFTRFRDCHSSTYQDPQVGQLLTRVLDLNALDFPTQLSSSDSFLCSMYLAHRFDVLGSGWKRNAYGVQADGFEGNVYHDQTVIDETDFAGQWLGSVLRPAHLKNAQSIWRLLTSKPEGQAYQPIDWQLDIRSGYRFSSKQWFRPQPTAPKPGVDIKSPWELSRMQHLPVLAFAYGATKDEHYIWEFRNQVLDFAATNPPRMGVNWSCTMDVAIRVANVLLAFDIFSQLEGSQVDGGAVLDQEFLHFFETFVGQHGVHIRNYLEWSPSHRRNHYLANIVGLLCVSRHLSSDLARSWFSFAREELIKEIVLQFSPDGSNVEESTSYHRLSAEMAVFGLALLSDSERKNFAPLVLRMSDVSSKLMLGDGSVAQFGDNDSGRLFKVDQSLSFLSFRDAKKKYCNLVNFSEFADDDLYAVENALDHGHLVAAVDGLLHAAQPAPHSYSKQFQVVRAYVDGA